MESGLRPLLDFGRCCHESVPERDRVLAGGEFGVSSAMFIAMTVWDEGDEMLVGVLLLAAVVLGIGPFSGERERVRSGEEGVSASQTNNKNHYRAYV